MPPRPRKSRKRSRATPASVEDAPPATRPRTDSPWPYIIDLWFQIKGHVYLNYLDLCVLQGTSKSAQQKCVPLMAHRRATYWKPEAMGNDAHLCGNADRDFNVLDTCRRQEFWGPRPTTGVDITCFVACHPQRYLSVEDVVRHATPLELGQRFMVDYLFLARWSPTTWTFMETYSNQRFSRMPSNPDENPYLQRLAVRAAGEYCSGSGDTSRAALLMEKERMMYALLRSKPDSDNVIVRCALYTQSQALLCRVLKDGWGVTEQDMYYAAKYFQYDNFERLWLVFSRRRVPMTGDAEAATVAMGIEMDDAWHRGYWGYVLCRAFKIWPERGRTAEALVYLHEAKCCRDCDAGSVFYRTAPIRWT
jgi:hypothetical protein